MHLNLQFTVNLYVRLIQVCETRGNPLFNDFWMTRGKYRALVLEISFWPIVLRGHHLHNYVADGSGFYADLVYVVCSIIPYIAQCISQIGAMNIQGCAIERKQGIQLIFDLRYWEWLHITCVVQVDNHCNTEAVARMLFPLHVLVLWLVTPHE